MGRDRVGTVGTMVGDKGNGLSIKGSRSKNTVRLLGPHAAAKTPLKKSEKKVPSTNGSERVSDS